MEKRNISLNEISRILELKLIGKNYCINGLNLCNKNSIHNSIISYITSNKYIRYIRQNPLVKALILTQEMYDLMNEEFTDLSFFITDYPEETFYDLHAYLCNLNIFYEQFNFEKTIGDNCLIHESAILENGIEIGNNVRIGQNTVIKKGTIIEDNVKIGCGSIIGSEGFQLISDHSGNNKLIKHIGGCHIRKNVSIGDNTTICNSLFENTTVIGFNTKIDNLVHVAHNCIIGDNCVLTAGVILSGSTLIGNNVWIAPNSTISNHVILENNSFIGIGSVVLKKIKERSKVFGNPAKEI